MSLVCSCNGEDGVQSQDEIVFTDALGREVSVDTKPERVAALLGSFADLWLLAGGELCACPEDAWEDFGFVSDSAINLGGAHTPSLELLIASDPDLVIASASTAANVNMLEVLESIGITVAYFDVDSFEDYLNMLDICTDITGRKDLFIQNGRELESQIELIKSNYSADSLTDEYKKVLLLRASSTGVKAKGSEGTVLGEMLKDMGCINIADSEQGLLENLSVEAIIREEPHIIFVVTMGNDTEKAILSIRKMINENPAWSTLEAVKADRFYVMDKTLFNIKPNARWAEAYAELYEKLTEK